jgi:transcriptional/translational regulatory protein YebC/TACO1
VGLEAGADDVTEEADGSMTVLTPWEELGRIAQAMRERGLEPAAAEASMLADTTVPLAHEQALAVHKLIETLEELDDVQNVYSNGDFPVSAFGG